jgi:hypothetical protein
MMTNNDVARKNPLEEMGIDMGVLGEKGGFGAVMAAAGVGKTALLVQIAIIAMMKKFSVLHVSLSDPVQKVTLWYDEILQSLSRAQLCGNTPTLQEDILRRRFIMTFRVDDFTVPKLEERLHDLAIQNIFSPHVLIIDGLRFDDGRVEPLLRELEEMVRKRNFFVWFAVHIPQGDRKAPTKDPLSAMELLDCFQLVLKIEDRGHYHILQLLQGEAGTEKGDKKELRLDPTTLLAISR